MPSLRGALSNQQNFLPPLLYRRITITSNQWLNLFTVPVVVMLDIPNKIIIPQGIQYIFKQPGIAYSHAAVTDLRGTFSISSSRWYEVAAAQLVGFTDVTTQSILLMYGARAAVSGGVITSLGNLLLTTTGGDFTAGTGDFVMWISYRIYDISNLAWF